MENEDYRAALKAELLGLKENGVSFSLNGKIVAPGDRLVDQLLTDKDYTYMRNYRFRNGKIVAIEFDKIRLNES